MIKIVALFPLFALMCGCATISPKHTFKDGRYWLTITWEGRRPYCQLVQIKKNCGDLRFTSTLNGNPVLNGILEEEKFYANTDIWDGRYASYRGQIVSDNHIKGTIRGRIIKHITKAYRFGEKVETIPATGTFDIRTEKQPTSRATSFRG